jgi:transposase-like protein
MGVKLKIKFPELPKFKKWYKSLPFLKRKIVGNYVTGDVNARTLASTLNKLVSVKQENEGGLKCPYCGRKRNIVKYGIRRGNQWYKCKNCEKTFSNVTNTFLDSSKKGLEVWEKFIECMIHKFAIRKTADICKINIKTAFAWRHKFLDALSQYQDKYLSGIVELDDTFFRLSFKGSRPIGRRARKRGRSTPKRGSRPMRRGIHKGLVSVTCAVARNGRIFSKVTSRGRPTAEKIHKHFIRRFSSKKPVILCTDKDTAYRKFAAEKEFEHKLLGQGGATSVRRKYHVQTVNNYHYLLKEFIDSFHGVSTKYLDNYLVWFNVISRKKPTKERLLNKYIKAGNDTRWNNVSNRLSMPE